MSLGKKASIGAIWQLSGGLFQALVRVGASVYLARQLEPEHFGIFGIATIVYGLFELLSVAGMTSGVLVKDSLDKKDLSTCFWLVMGARLVLMLCLFFSASFIAVYMESPPVEEVIRFIAIIILITGVGAIPQTLLVREMRFKVLVLIRLSGILFESSLAVALVYYTDLTYMALAISMLVGVCYMNLCYLFIAKWLPAFLFSYKRAKYFLFFGLNRLGSSISNYAGNNFDYIIVGKLLGTRELGFYEFAYRIPHMLNEKLTGPIGSVVFSHLAKVKNDPVELKRTFLSWFKYIVWITIPLYFGLAMVAHDLVYLLWGEKWLTIVVPMQILCISALLHGWGDLATYLFLIKEKPNVALRIDLITLVVTMLLVSVCGYIWGIVGIALGMLLSRSIKMLALVYAMSMIPCAASNALKIVWKPMVASAAMLLPVPLFEEYIHSSFTQLVVQIPSSALVYALITYLLFQSDWNQLKTEASKLIQK